MSTEMFLWVVAVGAEHVLGASEVRTKGTAVAKPSEEVGHATWARGRRADVPIPSCCVPTLCPHRHKCVSSEQSITLAFSAGGTWVARIQHPPVLDLLPAPGEK